METLLGKLNAVPGVVGSMICDPEGRVLGQAFPPAFDVARLGEAAAVLADGSVGLETVTGRIGLVDLRYGNSRIVAKPTPEGLVLLLCSRAVNLQLLMIELSVAGKKLERLVAAPGERAAPAPEPDAAVAEPVAEAPADPGKPKKKTSWWPSV
jgi:predicted regulator of Ras-like GTPase activity (Roadblock/LC7/MglB family)